MTVRHLRSFGVSRVHVPTRTAKIMQLVNAPTWSQAESKLGELAQTGRLTLKKATNNRLVLQWEPRIFPGREIKPQARQTLEPVRFDLTLAFETPHNRETFERWLAGSDLLHIDGRE